MMSDTAYATFATVFPVLMIALELQRFSVSRDGRYRWWNALVTTCRVFLYAYPWIGVYGFVVSLAGLTVNRPIPHLVNLSLISSAAALITLLAATATLRLFFLHSELDGKE